MKWLSQRPPKTSRAHYEHLYCELGRVVWSHYRASALSQVNQAVKAGHIRSLPDGETLCSVCQSEPASIWEHRNYTDPLHVVPACFSCNRLEAAARLPLETVREHLHGWWDFPYGPDPKVTLDGLNGVNRRRICAPLGVNEYNRRLKALNAGVVDLG